MFEQMRIAKDHQARLRAEAKSHRRAAGATDVATTVVDAATRTPFRRPELVIGSVLPAIR